MTIVPGVYVQLVLLVMIVKQTLMIAILIPVKMEEYVKMESIPSPVFVKMALLEPHAVSLIIKEIRQLYSIMRNKIQMI